MEKEKEKTNKPGTRQNTKFIWEKYVSSFKHLKGNKKEWQEWCWGHLPFVEYLVCSAL